MVLHALDAHYKDCLREAVGLAVSTLNRKSERGTRIVILVPSIVARSATLCATDDLVESVSALSAIEIVQVDTIQDILELIQDDSLTHYSILTCCISFIARFNGSLRSGHLHLILSLLSQSFGDVAVVEPIETLSDSPDTKAIIEWVTKL